MKILITGIAGFVGSHLAEHLVSQGHTVFGVDNFSSGKQSNLNQLNRLNTNNCDCRDLPKLQFVVNRRRPDFIFHLAATVGVNRVLANPKECIENNIESLRNVLSFGIPGLYTSTSEVYGKTTTPLAEDSDLVYSSKNRWSYAASKLVGEWLALADGWKVVRLFNVIGPRQSNHYGAVVPTFISQAITSQPITVHGNGSQIRSFINVKDCVRILGDLIDKKFDVVNVGNMQSYTIEDLAYKVKYKLNSNSRVSYLPYSEAYPEGFEECPCREPNLFKLFSLIGTRNRISLDDTILEIAESIKGVMPTESTKSISNTTDTRAPSVAVLGD